MQRFDLRESFQIKACLERLGEENALISKIFWCDCTGLQLLPRRLRGEWRIPTAADDRTDCRQRLSKQHDCDSTRHGHTACTRMLEGGVPYPVVASIMGWSAATAIRMSKRYGHIGQKAHLNAVALLNGSSKILTE